MILIARHSSTPDCYHFDYRRLDGKKRTLADAQALLEKLPGGGRIYLKPTIDRSREPCAPLTFAESELEALLDKILSKRNFELGEKEVGVGIDVHQDFLNRKGRSALGGDFSVGQGIFNLSHDEKLALHLTKAEQTLVKPFYTSAELTRYYGSSENRLWVIYTDSRFKDAAEIEDFPNLKRHLDQFNRVITSDNRPYGLHRARDEKFFLGEKIISLRKCAEPCFTFTDFPCYVSQTHIIIKTDRVNMQYLTALLNSRLVRFWLKHRGKMQGENFQVDKEPLLGIPILVPKKSEQERLARITSKVIECKKKMAEVTTDAAQTQLLRTAEHFEEQLQEAIETQYGLDEQERRLLSGA